MVFQPIPAQSHILSSFTSQFSEVIMPLINALINYSKLGAQCHILCIQQFDTLKLNFVLIEALIYKHITTFQVDSVQSKLQACTFEVRKVVCLSESIVSWDLEELEIIFLVNCDFLLNSSHPTCRIVQRFLYSPNTTNRSIRTPVLFR